MVLIIIYVECGVYTTRKRVHRLLDIQIDPTPPNYPIFITFKLKPSFFPDPETNEKPKCCLFLNSKNHFDFRQCFSFQFLFSVPLCWKKKKTSCFVFIFLFQLYLTAQQKQRCFLFPFYVFILGLTAWLVLCPFGVKYLPKFICLMMTFYVGTFCLVVVYSFVS